MDSIVCPVCTLYLRNNITLEDHLKTHPKNKVIEALITLSSRKAAAAICAPTPPWQQSALQANNSVFVPVQTNNSSIIYQQFVSSNTTHNCLPTMPPNMVPQYITIPAQGGFNQPLLMNQQPYLYQHQQQLQVMNAPTLIPLGYPHPNFPPQGHPVITESIAEPPKSIEPILERHPVISVNKLSEPENPAPVESIDLIDKPIPSSGIETRSQTMERVPVVCVNKTASTTPPVSVQIIESKKAVTPSVSVSTIQLADITISTEVVQKDQISPEFCDQMEIIPIYDKLHSRTENHNEQKMEAQTLSQDGNIEMDETKVGKNTHIIEVYSNEISDEKTGEEAFDDSAETFHEDEDDENVAEAEDKGENLIIIQKLDEKPQMSQEEHDYNLPEVTFFQIPKFEDQCPPEPEAKLPESKNDIVIIQNEVICLPPSKTGMFSMANDEDACFKVEQNDLDTASYLGGELVEFADLKLMLNEAVGTSGTATAVKDLHCTEDIYDDDKSSPILLNIGEMIADRKQDIGDHEDALLDKVADMMTEYSENYSRDSLNIRADECMPPKGELSEQESNGAGDGEAWGKIFQEGSSGISTSYDLMARESWESDTSDSEVMPPLQSRVPPPVNSTSCSSSSKSQEKVYQCCFCQESFFCPKERRVHQSKVHDGQTGNGMLDDDKPDVKFEATEVIFTKAFKSETIDAKIEAPPDSKHKHCDICKTEFKTTKLFAEHHRCEHPDTPVPRYKCATCPLSFAVECQFTEHLKVHPLVCSICYKLFYKRQNLKIHLRRHTSTSPKRRTKHLSKRFSCNVCNKQFATINQKVEHMASHDFVTTSFKCKLCKETFRRRPALTQHLEAMHGKRKVTRDYACHCGETFKSKNRYTWHSEIHESKPKSCTFCSEKFIHATSLTRHIRITHNDNYVPNERKITENVPCPVCKKMYMKSSLEVHIKIHTGLKPFACNICNKTFTTNWNLKLHKWTHAARVSKPFKCALCQGAFVRKSDYVAHMNAHRNIKPYTCNHCGRQFIRKYNCQRHVREHERDKSFKCTVCNKEFHRSYYLREHLRVHSGDRPFSCHICGKTSTTKSNHNKHMRIHHARDPVSTEN